VAAAPAGVTEVFTSWKGIRVAIDLAGLAIAGGLFIVPSFAAVQAWAGADKRARVVAACNVLNAAYIVGGTLVVAALQASGVTLAQLFLILGVANLIVTALVWRTQP
jgi:acyl-[acyl-carrier-protein]-phospholipid O-acyltransferase/long-chain-fatty-acid--[acyl-carrier-protein] ligase